MTIRLSDIANPLIVPELISLQSAIVNITADDSIFVDYMNYWGRGSLINSDMARQSIILLAAVLSEYEYPQSMGISLDPNAKWSMRFELDGKKIIYLPRHNGGAITTTDYDSDGNVINATWERVNQPANVGIGLKFIEVTSEVIPHETIIVWPVGFSLATLPPAIKKLIYQEANYLTLSGVKDDGSNLPEKPAAVEYNRSLWQPIYDLEARFNA